MVPFNELIRRWRTTITDKRFEPMYEIDVRNDEHQSDLLRHKVKLKLDAACGKLHTRELHTLKLSPS